MCKGPLTPKLWSRHTAGECFVDLRLHVQGRKLILAEEPIVNGLTRARETGFLPFTFYDEVAISGVLEKLLLQYRGREVCFLRAEFFWSRARRICLLKRIACRLQSQSV